MKIISLIYETGKVIKKILDHLNIDEERRNQWAPPAVIRENTALICIVPYDDGWPNYEEPVFEF